MAYLENGNCALKLLCNISCFFENANEAKSLPLNNLLNLASFGDKEVDRYSSISLSLICFVIAVYLYVTTTSSSVIPSGRRGRGRGEFVILTLLKVFA